MAWEDGQKSNVEALIQAGDTLRNSGNKSSARGKYQQALNSARLMKEGYDKNNLISLINSKMSSL